MSYTQLKRKVTLPSTKSFKSNTGEAEADNKGETVDGQGEVAAVNGDKSVACKWSCCSTPSIRCCFLSPKE